MSRFVVTSQIENRILQDKFDAVKQELMYKMGEIPKITSDEEIFETIEAVSRFLKEAFLEMAGIVFVVCLAELDTTPNSFIHEGRVYMFKEVRERKFVTQHGIIRVPRRVYVDTDGNSYVPLGAKWNMPGEYAGI